MLDISHSNLYIRILISGQSDVEDLWYWRYMQRSKYPIHTSLKPESDYTKLFRVPLLMGIAIFTKKVTLEIMQTVPLIYFIPGRDTCQGDSGGPLWRNVKVVFSLLKNMERNWVFATNLIFLILISLQPDGVNLWIFKVRLLDLTEFIIWHWVAKV